MTADSDRVATDAQRLAFLRVQLYTALQTLDSVDLVEFRNLISEVSAMLDLRLVDPEESP